ncbi:MAG: YbbR-like domain-containing protein [Blautia hansenii]|nr:CdaR family protein [uncultured Blautia sp.]
MNKFTLKILSLAIAVLIWLIVRNVQDPVIVQTFYDIPVTLVNESYLSNNMKIPLLIDGDDTVKVRIKAEESVIKELKKEDIVAQADMTQIYMDATPKMVPVEVTCKGIADDNITVTPRNIQVDIENQTSVEKTIAVNTGDTTPDKDYEVGSLQANPEKVTISGPESIINKIDKVVAKIDVTGMKESNVELDSELKIYDKNQDELSEKQLSYLNLAGVQDNKIKIQAQFWKVQKNVKIGSEYSGSPQYGYEVDSVSVVPETLSLAGTDEALQKLAVEGNTLTIPASYIDVSGKDSDFDVKVDISELLPENMKLARDINSTVIATVKILPYNSRDYEVSPTQIKVENKPENMNYKFEPDKIVARIKAKEEDLDNLKTDDIQMKIDLKDAKAGENTLPVTVTLPEGYELVEDITVKVALIEASEK